MYGCSIAVNPYGLYVRTDIYIYVCIVIMILLSILMINNYNINYYSYYDIYGVM
jgi:hypothetical protein